MISNTYTHIENDSDVEWKFARSQVNSPVRLIISDRLFLCLVVDFIFR